MRFHSALSLAGVAIFLPLVLSSVAFGQITITEADFFEIGDSYTAMATPDSAPCATTTVLGAIGSTGQNNWDFTVYGAQTTRTLNYDYLDPSIGGFGGETIFPGAEFTQRLTNAGTISGYLYLSQDTLGRRAHGFYTPGMLPQPEAVFMPSAIDYPFPFTLGDTWSFSTQYDQDLDVLGTTIATQNIVFTQAEVNAWGTITLPNLGTLNCVRVMELQETQVFADILGTGMFTFLDAITIRAYAWFAEGSDCVARIVSQPYSQTVTPGSPCSVGTPPLDFSAEVQIFQIQVGNTGPATAPTITAIPDQVITEINAPYSFPVIASGSPSPTYTLSAAPAGMTIGVTSGLIEWTPGPGELGSATVTVEASNSAGVASESFLLDVVNANDPPTNLATNFVATGGTVSLSWDAPMTTTLLSGYEIRRSSTSGGPYTVAGNVAPGVTTFDDNPPALGSGVFYVVVAEFSLGGLTSDPSNEVFAYVPLATETVLSGDDGSAESGLTLSGLNSEMAVNYTLPSAAQIRLTKVAIFVEDFIGAPLTIKAYEDDNGVMPGSSLAQLQFLAADLGPGWNVLAIQPEFLQPVFNGGGDFFVGVVESGTDNAIGVDTDSSGNSWTMAAGGAWSFLSGGQLMIRPILDGDIMTGDMFIRGDANADGMFNIADAVFTLAALFSMGPVFCEYAMDANDDNMVNIADAVSILGSLFGGDPPPSAPHPTCGTDSDNGTLTCNSFSACP